VDSKRGASSAMRSSTPSVAIACADRNPFAARGAAAAQHGCAGLGLHARPESVFLHAAAAIRLKCALGHRIALLFPFLFLRLVGKL